MLLIYCGLGFCIILWWPKLALIWRPASDTGRHISWIFLIASLLAGIIRFEPRNMSDLMIEGLSFQNRLQVAITLLAACWAFFLILSKRVRISYMFYGSGFWITILILLYSISIFWSVWPKLTAYRVIELGAFWIIAKHLFAHKQWQKEIHKLLLATFVIVWIRAVIFPDLDIIKGSNFVITGRSFIAAIMTNTGSLVAAIFIVYLVFRLMKNHNIILWFELIIATISLFIFGSLVSLIALIGGLVVLFLFNKKATISFTLLMFLLFIIFFSSFCSLNFTINENPIFGWEQLAELYGKSQVNIANWTGRLPYWITVWRIAKDNPLGLGFAAGERLIAINPQFTTPKLAHSHNGYISAWLGAGWPGITVLVFVFVAVWISTKYMSSMIQPLILSILIVLAINNLTINAVGGQFKSTFILIMALASLPINLKKIVHRSGIESLII